MNNNNQYNPSDNYGYVNVQKNGPPRIIAQTQANILFDNAIYHGAI